MRKITIIEFSPQNINETREVVREAMEIMEHTQKDVYLKPYSNLIQTDCLLYLEESNFHLDRTEFGAMFVFIKIG